MNQQPFSPKATGDLVSQISQFYPDYSRNSFLDRALERIKASVNPDHDLEILRQFTSTLPEEEFLIFSGVDVSVNQRIRVAPSGVEYWEELSDIYPLFDDESTQMVCLRGNGDVWWENLSKEFVQIESLYFPRKSFDILVRACGYKVKGMKPMVITDAETGLRITYAANGFRKDPMPAVVIRRANEL